LASASVDEAGFRYINLQNLEWLRLDEFLAAPAPSVEPTSLSPVALKILVKSQAMGCQVIPDFSQQGGALYRRTNKRGYDIYLRDHFRFGQDHKAWIEDSICRCVVRVLIERAESRIVDLRETNPFVWEDTISVATATKAIIQAFGGTPLPVHAVDIAACSRKLSDQEVEQAAELGTLIANEFINAPRGGR